MLLGALLADMIDAMGKIQPVSPGGFRAVSQARLLHSIEFADDASLLMRLRGSKQRVTLRMASDRLRQFDLFALRAQLDADPPLALLQLYRQQGVSRRLPSVAGLSRQSYSAAEITALINHVLTRKLIAAALTRGTQHTLQVDLAKVEMGRWARYYRPPNTLCPQSWLTRVWQTVEQYVGGRVELMRAEVAELITQIDIGLEAALEAERPEWDSSVHSNAL